MLMVLLPPKKMSKYIREKNPHCEISESFIRRLAINGDIASLRVGSKILISYESLEEYLNEQLRG